MLDLDNPKLVITEDNLPDVARRLAQILASNLLSFQHLGATVGSQAPKVIPMGFATSIGVNRGGFGMDQSMLPLALQSVAFPGCSCCDLRLIEGAIQLLVMSWGDLRNSRGEVSRQHRFSVGDALTFGIADGEMTLLQESLAGGIFGVTRWGANESSYRHFASERPLRIGGTE